LSAPIVVSAMSRTTNARDWISGRRVSVLVAPDADCCKVPRIGIESGTWYEREMTTEAEASLPLLES